MTYEIINGSSLEELKKLPGKSINMCITSPPYWALRDYGVDEQLGLEPTFDKYISNLCDIFDEVKNVLRDDGTCWVNLGDTYFGSGKGAGGDGKNKESFTFTEKETRICHNCKKEFIGWKFQNFCGSACSGVDNTPRNKKGKLPDKTLTMIPMRFAIEMVNRGWILRNTIIWHKPNAMPCSVKDRFTVDFEYIFLFSKKKKYYFEQQFEELKTNENRDFGMVRQRKLDYKSKYEGIHFEKTVRQGMHKERGNNLVEKRDLPLQKIFVDKLRKNFNINDLINKGIKKTTAEHWFRYDEGGFSYPTKEEWKKLNTDMFPELLDVFYVKDDIKSNKNGRNKRTTWSFNTKPFKEAHFAVYPEELCETPINAGCPEGGVVLDPFAGAGTTGLVAEKQNKNSILIELNPEYCDIIRKRLNPYIEQTKLDAILGESAQ